MAGIIFALFISIVVPVLIFCYAFYKKRAMIFILGAITFTVSQILIRIPILQYLSENSATYSLYSVTNPILFVIFLGLSAGIFEELGRFIVMNYFMKQDDWNAGFLFGAGHGGIEAILIVGINVIPLLFSTVAITYNEIMFATGVERLFAMLIHIGLSIIVLQGVVRKKFSYVIIAIIIHGFIDILAGILPMYIKGSNSIIVVESVLGIAAVAVFYYALLIKRKGVIK